MRLRVSPNDRKLGEFLRFLVVGGSGTVLNLAVFSFCLHVVFPNTALSPAAGRSVAATVAFVCAVTSNYYWNRRWTFRWGGRPGAQAQYCEFVTLSIYTLGVNLLVLEAAASLLRLPAILAQMTGIAAGTLCNFAGNKLWVFNERKPRLLWVLALIVLVAIVLRAAGLSKESLWLDEAASVSFASGTLGRAAASEATNPPLYYIVLHLWMQVFGTSEAAVRALSILPSIAAIILTYFLGRRLYNEKAGLVAAGFMAVSTFHVFYAQEARGFALLLALLLGSMLSMDIALSETDAHRRRRAWAVYFLSTVAALYTHLYAVFFIAAENVFFLMRWRETRRRLVPWVIAQFLIVVVFVPWLASRAGGGQQDRAGLPLKVAQAGFCFLAGESLIPFDEAAKRDMSGTLRANAPLILAAALGFGALLAVALVHARRSWRASLFFLALCVVPNVLGIIVAVKMQNYDRRYVIAASPVLYLFIAAGVVGVFGSDGRLRRALRALTVAASVLVAAVLVVALVQYYLHPRFGKEQWREAVEHVESRARPTDLVVLHRGYIGTAYDYYAERYAREHAAARTGTLRLKDAIDADDRATREAAWRAAVGVIQRHERVWLVRSHVADDAVLDRFRGLFREKAHATFPRAKGIDVYLMER